MHIIVRNGILNDVLGFLCFRTSIDRLLTTEVGEFLKSAVADFLTHDKNLFDVLLDVLVILIGIARVTLDTRFEETVDTDFGV